MLSLQQVLQLGLGQDSLIGWILQIVFYAFFVVFLFYGQRIQIMIMIREVEGSLLKLKIMRDEARKVAIAAINEIGKPQTDQTAQVDRFLEYFAITPVNLDPAGIIWRLEHLLDVQDTRFKDDIKLMAPQADDTQINNLEGTLEVALGLNIIYKVIRHFYLLGKKTLSLYMIMQVQMILPMIMKEAEAYSSAIKAFQLGQPIGDGAGALVAAKLMRDYEKTKVEKDCVVAKVPIEGRTAYVLKAEGPGGNVGKPGEAIKQIMEQNEGKISLVIMIDAGGKLEGEKTGEVAEGVGAIIGGPEVDKYKVEETALKYKVPVLAVAIKEDLGDAIAPMRKEVFDALDDVIDRVKRVIRERTKEGDFVIIAGIGNSVGIGQ
jgi:hypothetical protein